MQISLDTGESSMGSKPTENHRTVHMEALSMGVVSLQYGMPHGEP